MRSSGALLRSNRALPLWATCRGERQEVGVLRTPRERRSDVVVANESAWLEHERAVRFGRKAVALVREIRDLLARPEPKLKRRKLRRRKGR